MIYFLRHVETGVLKIGTTVDYPMRLSQLIAKYGDMELLGLMTGSYDIEGELRRKFGKYHTNILQGTEWYHPAHEIVEYIKSHSKLSIPLPLDRRVRRSPLPHIKPNRAGLISNLPNLIIHFLNETGLTKIELARLSGLKLSALSGLIYSSSPIVDLEKAAQLKRVIGFRIEDLIIEVPDMSYDRSKRNVS